MKAKGALYVSIASVILGLASNGLHLYRLAENATAPKGVYFPLWQMAALVAGIAAFEIAIFLLALKGSKGYAMFAAAISFMVSVAYISRQAYVAEGWDFSPMWAAETLLSCAWMFFYVASVYVFSELIAGHMKQVEVKGLVEENKALKEEVRGYKAQGAGVNREAANNGKHN